MQFRPRSIISVYPIASGAITLILNWESSFPLVEHICKKQVHRFWRGGRRRRRGSPFLGRHDLELRKLLQHVTVSVCTTARETWTVTRRYSRGKGVCRCDTFRLTILRGLVDIPFLLWNGLLQCPSARLPARHGSQPGNSGFVLIPDGRLDVGNREGRTGEYAERRRLSM